MSSWLTHLVDRGQELPDGVVHSIVVKVKDDNLDGAIVVAVA